jgi:hypothetical protein
MWRFLRHPNVLSLVGVMMSENRFAMVSDWMSNGDINEFVEKCPDVDRLGLVSFPFEVSRSPPDNNRISSSWQVLLKD